MHVFNCEMSIALTYSMRRPRIARDAATRALFAAIAMGRPDLAWQANALLGAL